MSVDFGALFSGASQAIQSTVSQVTSVAAPSVEASLEQWGASTLNTMANQSSAAAGNAIQQVLNSPGAPSPFVQYLKGVISAPVLQKYGPYVIVGVIGVILVGYYIGRS